MDELKIIKKVKDKIIYSKLYKNYFYTYERLHNTVNGHPNYRITIFHDVTNIATRPIMTFNVSTYMDVEQFVEMYINTKM